MSKEKEQIPDWSKPYRRFGFTEQEFSRWKISNDRFNEFLKNPLLNVLEVLESSNNYGDFIFITFNRRNERERLDFTFYGLGYHEYRERWITEEWYWYRANILKGKPRTALAKSKVGAMIEQRRREILPFCMEEERSERARLFEYLADLTDEDGAISELEDLDL